MPSAGSSAVVHRAWDRERGTAVAVKLTADVGVHDPRRHRRGIDTLTRVRHPELVALHDGGVDDGVPYLVLACSDFPTATTSYREGKEGVGDK